MDHHDPEDFARGLTAAARRAHQLREQMIDDCFRWAGLRLRAGVRVLRERWARARSGRGVQPGT